MSCCLFPWTDNPCCFSFFFKSRSESKLYTVLGSGFLLWTELKRRKKGITEGYCELSNAFHVKSNLPSAQYRGDGENCRNISIKMEKRRRTKFVNQVDSIHMTVTRLRWWWDSQTEGSRWQPILGESGLRQRSGLKMHTWDSCRRLWTKCHENVGSHLYEIIQFFTSLKHVFPKICPWFPGKISIKS